ncbi:hypothetical protein ACFQ3Z_02670 [Streptomyces nogalater]
MDDWWVMLPDSRAAAAVAARLGREGVRRVPHASGRPWLVGRWDARQEVSARAGEARVVVLGRSTARAGTLRRRIERVRLPAEAERAVSGLAGSFHVLASVGGRVWARGTASAVCRVFTTHRRGTGGVTAPMCWPRCRARIRIRRRWPCGSCTRR